MIEVLKQALEALKDVGVLTDREWQAVHKNKANELRQAIAELESQEPVAHCTVRPLRGDESYPKTEILWVKGKPIAGPLYTHPPQRTEQNFCSRCGKRVGGIDSIHTCTPPMEKNT
jgi:hypothetical protein